MGQNNGWLARLLAPFFQLGAISPEQGAQTSIYLASSPEVEGVTGQYFVNEKPARSSAAASAQAAAQRLWQMSAEMSRL